jgi:hypothetical protein
MGFEPGSAVLVAVIMLVFGAGAVQVAGFFPLRDLPPELSSPGVRTLIIGDAAVLLALLGSALFVATRGLGWPLTVIIAGLAILAGPLLFQAMPRSWRDGRSGLAALFGAGVAIIVVVWWQAIP